MNPSQVPHFNDPQAASQPRKLLDRLRLLLEQERVEATTIGRFVEWNRRLILF
jgi:hypothetical protein